MEISNLLKRESRPLTRPDWHTIRIMTRPLYKEIKYRYYQRWNFIRDKPYLQYNQIFKYVFNIVF